MAGDSKSSFQNLGNGTYRVTGAHVSPSSGRYIIRESSSGQSSSKSSAPSNGSSTKRGK